MRLNRDLVKAGATVLLGGQVPDDAAHRMGWRLPATVLMLHGPDSPAAPREQELPPAGTLPGAVILRAKTGTWPAGEMLAPAWTGQAR